MRILRWITENSIKAGIIFLALTVLLVINIRGLEIDTSSEGMMVEGDPARVFYDETIKTFGSDNLTTIFIRDDNLFSYKVLKVIEDITYSLEEIDGVERVESLFTVKNMKGEGGFINTNPLIDWLEDDPEQISQIKDDALRNPIILGNLVSRDGKATAINIYSEPRRGDKNFNKGLTTKVQKIIDSKEGQVSVIFQHGLPFTKVNFSDYIQKDQLTLVPISAVFLMFLLLLSLRSASGVLLPITTATLSVIWTLGFMGYMKIPINVLTVIVPSLLIVIGSTEDVHLLSEYLEGIDEHKNRKGALLFMIGRVGLPIFLTFITTYIGFLSIAVSKITLLKQFGIVSSFGLLANFIATITVVPLYLKYLGPKRVKKHAGGGEKKDIYTISRDFALNLLTKHRSLIVLAFLAVVVAGAIGTMRVRINTDLISYFKKSSPVQTRNREIHQSLAGLQTFYITFDTHRADGMKDPAVLDKILELERFLKSNHTDKTVSISDQIALVNREMNDGQDKFYSIPAKRDLISQYLLMFENKDINRYVNSDFSKGNMIVRHNITSSYELTTLLEKTRSFIEMRFPKNVEARFTGENILINNAADTMAGGVFQSLGITLAIIFIMMSILFLSFKAGFLSLIPNIVPIVIIFGIMGWLDIPLSTATSMIAAIAIGIAVDDTIHFMVRYYKEMKKSQDQTRAMVDSLRSEIKPILSTSIALTGGFGILVLSNFVPTIYFGALSAIVMVVAVLTDMLLTPLLLSTTQLITIWDMVALELKRDVIKNSELFRGMSKSQVKKIVLLSKIREFDEGECVFKEGAVGREMYVVLDGGVSVEKVTETERRVIADLGEGEIFGEMALVTAGKRSSDIVATQNTRTLEIDNNALDRIRKRFPFISSKLFLNLSRILSKRLSDTDAMLALARKG